MKKVIRILLASMFLASVAAAPVFAEEGASIFKRKGCTICHGTDAKNTRSSAYPRLAGQHADYIKAQLVDFKAKTRNSGRSKEMIPFANSLTEAQMDAVAKYVSGL